MGSAKNSSGLDIHKANDSVINEEEVEDSPSVQEPFFKAPEKKVFQQPAKLMVKEAYSKPVPATKEMVREAKKAVDKHVRESITKKVFSQRHATYLNEKKSKPAQEIFEEFEEVADKKKRRDSFDSASSEDYRVP